MRKKLAALPVVFALCLAFMLTAFAADAAYKTGQTVEISGQTDFDYFYTYSDTDYTIYPYKEENYKCFSVVAEDGQRFYAAVKECRYEYSRAAFAGQTVTLKGKYQQTAGDGAPVVLVSDKVTQDEKGREVCTPIGDCIWDVVGHGKAPDETFRIIRSVYPDVVTALSEDGSYLMVDTNPYDRKSGTTYQAAGLTRIKEVNGALGLPDWLYEEMVQTRALDGRQKETFDHVTVTWSYHPDHGLEVMYRKN